jgi:hypothetical protein
MGGSEGQNPFSIEDLPNQGKNKAFSEWKPKIIVEPPLL